MALDLSPIDYFRWLAAGVTLALVVTLLWVDFNSKLHRALGLLLTLEASVRILLPLDGASDDRLAAAARSTTGYIEIAIAIAVLYFLYIFLLHHQRPKRRNALWVGPWIPVALLLLGFGLEYAYFRDHSLILACAGGVCELGPLSLVLSIDAAVIAAGLVLALTYTRLPPGKPRTSALLLILGLIATNFYSSTIFLGVNTVTYIVHAEARAAFHETRFFLLNVTELVNLVFAVVILGILLRHALGSGDPRIRRECRLGVTTLAAALGSGAILGGWLGTADATNFRIPVTFTQIGGTLWNLAEAFFLGYALLKYRLFQIDIQIKTGLKAGTVALIGLLIFAGVTILSRPWLPDPKDVLSPGLGILVAGGTVALANAPLRRASQRIANAILPAVDSESTDYLALRKLEVYRAALEEAQLRGLGESTEEAFLTDLRRRLGVSDTEHRVMLTMIRALQRRGPAPGPLGGDRFRIERELGRGSFGIASLAYDKVLARSVVLKQPLAPWLLDARGRELFLREARLAARIVHPNVVTVYEVMPNSDPPALLLEYVPGGSLEDRLRRKGGLAPNETARIILDVLSGLQRLHESKIIHRDLKPANILLTTEGVAKITDFGIARPPAELSATITLSEANAQPGSLAYMSPEQARGADVGPRSDLYAVGAILYRCFTGKSYLPFERLSDFEARRRIQSEAVRLDDARIPAAFQRVLARAFQKEAKARHASAAQMAKDLRAATLPDDRATPIAVSSKSRIQVTSK